MTSLVQRSGQNDGIQPLITPYLSSRRHLSLSTRDRQLSLFRYGWVHKLPFFYGWVIVLLAAFTLFATTPGQSDSFSFFFNSFVEEFGWSRTFVSSLYSGATLLSGFLMFYVGRLVDRIGSKWVAILAAVLLGFACMLTSYVMSPVMLFLGFFLARLAGKGALELSASTMAPQWFISRRALAIMLVGLGGTAGGIIFPLLLSYLITTHGWRPAYRLLAAGLWLIYVPIALVFLIARPEDVGLAPDNRAQPLKDEPAAVEPEEPALDRSQAVRTAAFWIVTLCIFQNSLVGTGVVLHFVSMFETQGLTMVFAAQILGIKTLVSLITTILAGLVLDRFRRHQYVLAFACLLQVAGYLLLAFLQDSNMAVLYALLGGISNGLLFLSIGVLVPNLFGRRFLGGIYGVQVALNVIGSAIGPVLFGAAFDWVQGYTAVIIFSSLLPLVSGVLCLFIRKPVPGG
jgi:MFS family permease